MKRFKKPLALLFIISTLFLSLGGIQKAKADHVVCTNCDYTGVWCEVLYKYLYRCTYNGTYCDVSKQELCED